MEMSLYFGAYSLLRSRASLDRDRPGLTPGSDGIELDCAARMTRIEDTIPRSAGVWRGRSKPSNPQPSAVDRDPEPQPHATRAPDFQALQRECLHVPGKAGYNATGRGN